jgi:HEAT repeat protein
VVGLLLLVFAGAALLGARSLRAQERSGPPKAKSNADAGKSADAIQDAIRREIASLSQARNWRGLVAKLRDKDSAVRRQAAFALQRVVPDVKRDAELKQLLPPLVDDQAALKSIVLPMAEALKAEEVKRRRYAAHAVMLLGHKVEDKAALWPLVQPLVAAHFHDPDEAARRSAGLALERTFGRAPEPK